MDVRSDFPLLRREIDGKPIVYLDSAATAQKPEAVLATMDDFYRRHYASIHRGVYTLGAESTAAFEGARARIAAFAGGETATTLFTANATASINLVAYAWGRDYIGAGDVILLTQLEHHSNIVPWQVLAEQVGAEIRYLHVGDDGTLSLDQLDEELRGGRVRLAAFAHVSNVLGTINPVAEMVARARAAGAVTVLDGAQAVPQLPVDVGAIGADFYAWTGHKALGPTGIGVLHGRRELLQSMRPFITGGHMIKEVGFDRSTWNDLPWKFEAGTSQIAEAVGLGVAVDYLDELGMEAVREHERTLTAYALERLAETDGVTVPGPPDADRRGGVISFAVEGMHPHDVAELLDRDNVCVRAGHHCAQPLMRALGVPATARASFGPYNDRADVDALIESIVRARSVFA
ncbi:MAG TPA: SufS family cysteine desulfurase [Solirubrobacteraceae bacterium]|jgi:cysteine desulfurase/selenocysteine lyase|nr:SufS family cysteine desulfurase [Solirubrobacteraceae bacterium]